MAKILIVEDDLFFRNALKEYLSSQQHSVAEASNGRIAQNVLAIQPFDIVITDLQMPFFDGLELLDWIKQTYPTPVIIMAGFTDSLTYESIFLKGADGILNKPFNCEDLILTISAVLRQPKQDAPQTENPVQS